MRFTLMESQKREINLTLKTNLILLNYQAQQKITTGHINAISTPGMPSVTILDPEVLYTPYQQPFPDPPPPLFIQQWKASPHRPTSQPVQYVPAPEAMHKV